MPCSSTWTTTNKLGETDRQHSVSYCEPCWWLLLEARSTVPKAKPLTGLLALDEAGRALIETYEASVATAAAAAPKKPPRRKPTAPKKKPTPKKAPKKVTPRTRRSAGIPLAS